MGIFDTITDTIGGGLSYIGKTTSDFVKVGGTNPLSFLTNYAIGTTQKEPSLTNVVEVAQAGNDAVSGAVVGTGNAIKSAGESVVNTVTGGIDTIKKYLPVVAVGGAALLILSRKR